ncbi:Pv-fam-d protein [Plasmodium ovale curtisi]|uniref:Pv-fam-d protein n=1 Tax=Plasmodium ovale curtisi TaxID=864141 RepID=A0A1A8VQ60_PLAOA|nr:Pv-fam-d protein [Plasmodium ovale curtisi]
MCITGRRSLAEESKSESEFEQDCAIVKERLRGIIEDGYPYTERLNSLKHDDSVPEHLDGAPCNNSYNKLNDPLKYVDSYEGPFYNVENGKNFKIENTGKKQQFHNKYKRNNTIYKPLKLVYQLFKKTDSLIEKEIFRLLNTKSKDKPCMKHESIFKKLLYHIKKYRVLLPLFIFAIIAVVLLPSSFVLSITYATAGCSFLCSTIFTSSLLASFFIGTYYQIKYWKYKKIKKHIKMCKKRNKIT